MPKLCSVCGVTYSDALVFCPADGTTLRSADLREDLVGSVIADRYLVTDVLGKAGSGAIHIDVLDDYYADQQQRVRALILLLRLPFRLLSLHYSTARAEVFLRG